MLASRLRSQLLVIDLQDRIVQPMQDAQSILSDTIRLIGAARRLGVPITVTEHDPALNGRTIAVLASPLGEGVTTLTRQTFSVWREEAARARLRELRQAGRDQVVIVGCETHLCVLQTVLDLIANDFDVFVIADATASSRISDRDLALARMSRCGAAIASREMMAFEWLERAGTSEFNDLKPLVKT